MVCAFGISTFMIVLLVAIQQGASERDNDTDSAPSLTFIKQTGKCTLLGLEQCNCSWVSGSDNVDVINCSGLGFTNMSVLSDVGDTVKKIVFTGNDLTSLDVSVLKSATNLKILDLSSNNITTVMPNGFSQLPHLEELTLNNNGWFVDKDTEPVFQNVTLKKLYLNNAFARNYNATIKHVTNLDNVFGDKCVLNSLEKLQLASNDLHFVVSEIFCNMPKLRYLDLSHNQLSELPCSATCLGAIRHLLIQDNKLNHISSTCISQIQLLDMMKLNITDNPFICDCNMCDQYEWMHNVSSSTHFYDNEKDKLLCHSPTRLAGQPIFQLQNSDFVCLPYDSGNTKLKFILIVIGLIFALVAVGLLLLVFSRRKQIRSLFRGRHGDASMMSAGYTSMDA